MRSGQTSSTGNTLTFQALQPYRAGQPVQVSAVSPAGSSYVWQFTAGVRAGGGVFGGGSDPAVGYDPVSLAVGDLNHDGKLDVVCSNFDANSQAPGQQSLSVRLGQGDGTFVVPAGGGTVPVLPGGFPMGYMQLADLQGRGELDILVLQSNGVLFRCSGKGDGTFDSYQQLGLYSTGTAVGFDVADLNGDGLLDVVTVETGSTFGSKGTLNLYLGTGNGYFTSRANATLTVGIDPTQVVCADFNNDGRLDVATTNNGSASVSVALGNGKGGLGAVSGVAVGSYPTTLSAADLNNDGKTDLAVTNENGKSVSIRLGSGQGTFTKPSTPELTTGGTPSGVVAGDINGDGNLDLLVSNYALTENTVSVRLGNGTGAFNTPASGAAVQVGTRPVSPTLADLDNDGDLDLLTASFNAGLSSHTLSARLNNGTSALATATSHRAAELAVWPQPVAVGQSLQVALATAAPASLRLLTLLGQPVATATLPAGRPAELPTTGLAPGIYLLYVQTAGELLTRRVVLE